MLDVAIKSRYENIEDNYIKLYLADGSVVDEHRYLMTTLLGRELSNDEHVHHRDENKKNNSLDNLVLLSKEEHLALHRKELIERTRLLLVCAACAKAFYVRGSYYRRKHKNGQTVFYCSRYCSGSGKVEFSPQQVEEIKNSKESLRSLGKKYSVSHTLIQRVRLSP
jgi:hypothetical protein